MDARAWIMRETEDDSARFCSDCCRNEACRRPALVAPAGVGAAWRPALDEVWYFLRANPGLRTEGHNVFVYHHAARRDMPMNVDFGVEVVRPFEAEGEVHEVHTPEGEVAMAVHVGSCDRLNETYDAIYAWAAANNRAFAGTSWEIYGDWLEDPAKMETTLSIC